VLPVRARDVTQVPARQAGHLADAAGQHRAADPEGEAAYLRAVILGGMASAIEHAI
jgi:hypothetical protein